MRNEIRAQLKEQYSRQKEVFPMIASVIEENCPGQILHNEQCTHFFVINKFGFCQEIYWDYDEKFVRGSIGRLLQSKDRKKLRCYSPKELLKEELEKAHYAKRAQRMRLVQKKPGCVEACKVEKTKNVCVRKMTVSDLDREDFSLDLRERYYNGGEDFLEKAMPLAAMVDSEYAGIIYSCGNGNKMAEIDVFVKLSFRKQKIGSLLCGAFMRCCTENGYTPSWDCYSDNLASVRLAEACGFQKNFSYDFYNIEITD